MLTRTPKGRWEVLPLVLIVALALLPAPASATAVANCGRVTGGTYSSGQTIDPFTQYSYSVYANGVSCRLARAVGHAWGKATHFDGGVPLDAVVLGFSCERQTYTQTHPAATCTRSSETMHRSFQAS
jgi:hypothetical protein